MKKITLHSRSGPLLLAGAGLLALTVVLGYRLIAQAPPSIGAVPPNGTQVIKVGDVALEVHVAGQGPVGIIYPGGPGNDWQYLEMPALVRHMTLIYVQPAGSGNSSRLGVGHYSLEIALAHLAAIVDHLEVKDFYILGHSWGGITAQQYAIAYPARLRGLILYSTLARYDEAFEVAMNANISEYFSKEPWYADATAALAQMDNITASTSDEEYTQLWRRVMPPFFADYTARRKEYDPLINRTRCAAEPNVSPPGIKRPFDIDLRPSLGRVRAPTLIIAGARDVNCGPSIAQELLDCITGARLHVLQKSGHMGHIEEPEEFVRVVTGFVAEIEASARHR